MIWYDIISKNKWYFQCLPIAIAALSIGIILLCCKVHISKVTKKIQSQIQIFFWNFEFEISDIFFQKIISQSQYWLHPYMGIGVVQGGHIMLRDELTQMTSQ
jgi:hypothetical protein